MKFSDIKSRLAPFESLIKTILGGQIQVSNVHRILLSKIDHYGNKHPGPVEPIGDDGLKRYRTIDDTISEALGIPLAPEED